MESDCSKCIYDALQYLKMLKRNKEMNIAYNPLRSNELFPSQEPAGKEPQFKLKNLMAKYKGVPISPSQMTDELALLMLKQYPEKITLFEKYPENWQELAAQTEEKQPSQPPLLESDG